MAAYDDKSPLETAIDEGRMEIWNIMREGLELSEPEKLKQMRKMIMLDVSEEEKPWNEFKELLASVSVECSQIIQDELRLQQLSKAMYKEDKEEAKKEFSQLLGSLPPELVSSSNHCIYLSKVVGRLIFQSRLRLQR